jgi:hypothetical protein
LHPWPAPENQHAPEPDASINARGLARRLPRPKNDCKRRDQAALILEGQARGVGRRDGGRFSGCRAWARALLKVANWDFTIYTQCTLAQALRQLIRKDLTPRRCAMP